MRRPQIRFPVGLKKCGLRLCCARSSALSAAPDLFARQHAKFFRRRSGSPGPKQASTVAWVLVHTGVARASTLIPCGVNSSRRARWSLRFVVILMRLRRHRGLSAAVKVVRSIASSEATAPIVGASGRFKDIISENCPCVRPSGRNALSKRRPSAHAARWT